MTIGRSFFALAGASALALVLACSGKVAGGSGGGGAGGGSVCDDYFTAVFASGCPGGTTPPASELAHLQSQFDELCESTLALPGVGITSAGIAGCTAAIKAQGCGIQQASGGPCDLDAPGTLVAGAACVEDEQCASGDCSAGSASSDGGTSACGVCAAVAAIGASCANLGCGQGAACGPTQTCVAQTTGGAGAACDGYTTLCGKGTSCVQGQCAAPGATGAPCEDSEDCAYPLGCVTPAPGSASTCQTLGVAGSACTWSGDCGSSFVCDTDTTKKCVTPTWVSAGQACSSTSVCLVGDCPGTSNSTGETTYGTCPTVVAEGQPCSDSSTTSVCDGFAQCLGGICRTTYDGVCP